MTREQRYAREAITQMEGDLTEYTEGRTLVLQTFDGRLYRVDPDASRIQRIDHDQSVHTTDLCTLETAIEDPMWFGTPDPEPIDDSLYEDIFAREAARPVTDYHEDRWADLRADDRRKEHDRRYYAEREAA